MKQRKRGIRRMFAGAMAVLMVLSAVDVSGWGVMNAKAETALAENVPESLAIYSNESSTWQIVDSFREKKCISIIRFLINIKYFFRYSGYIVCSGQSFRKNAGRESGMSWIR
ncbi:MAG: hypothetical protein PUC55_05170 [Lachnospiraceae bacterium]|nr:hypothetical protein [Lachnospiraceae bacterium]